MELKDVIHYYLGNRILHTYPDKSYNEGTRVLTISKLQQITDPQTQDAKYWSSLQYWKLVLRRLSDMTDEECIECANILGGFPVMSDQAKAYQVRELFAKWHNHQTNIAGYTWMKVAHYLISQGFWIFSTDAFDNGAIIDSKTLTV